MKKLISVILAALICLSLTGCSEKPETYLEGYLSAVQSFDEAKMKDYGVYGDIVNSSAISSSSITQEQLNQIYKDILSGFTYEIGESNIDGDNATVKVSITNTDMSSVLSKYMTKLMAYALSSGSSKPSQESVEAKAKEVLLEEINSAQKSGTTKTTDVTVKMTKTDGEWKISDNTEIIDAAFGGLFSGTEAMEDQLNNLQ